MVCLRTFVVPLSKVAYRYMYMYFRTYMYFRSQRRLKVGKAVIFELSENWLDNLKGY